MIHFEIMHPRANAEMLGFIPTFLSERDPRPAAEQFDDAYRHGGGWHPFEGFKMLPDGSLKYPGDPAYQILAQAKLRDETISIYEHAWVAIVQKDGSFQVSRMD